MVDSQLWCEGHGGQRSGGVVIIQPGQFEQGAGKHRCAAAVAVTLSGSRLAVPHSLAQAVIQMRANVGDEPLTQRLCEAHRHSSFVGRQQLPGPAAADYLVGTIVLLEAEAANAIPALPREPVVCGHKVEPVAAIEPLRPPHHV